MPGERPGGPLAVHTTFNETHVNYIYFSETSNITLNEVFFELTSLALKEALH